MSVESRGGPPLAAWLSLISLDIAALMHTKNNTPWQTSVRVASFLAVWLLPVVLGSARGWFSQMHILPWYWPPLLAAVSVGLGVVTLVWIPVVVALVWLFVRFV
jgi:hypothetical protein